jgi:hypothetical protein
LAGLTPVPLTTFAQHVAPSERGHVNGECHKRSNGRVCGWPEQQRLGRAPRGHKHSPQSKVTAARAASWHWDQPARQGSSHRLAVPVTQSTSCPMHAESLGSNPCATKQPAHCALSFHAGPLGRWLFWVIPHITRSFTESYGMPAQSPWSFAPLIGACHGSPAPRFCPASITGCQERREAHCGV